MHNMLCQHLTGEGTDDREACRRMRYGLTLLFAQDVGVTYTGRCRAKPRLIFVDQTIGMFMRNSIRYLPGKEILECQFVLENEFDPL